MTYIATKTLFEQDADTFGGMSVAEAIEWLKDLAEGEPFPPEEITFRVHQSGDSWDGYGSASIIVERPETETEAVGREAKHKAYQEAKVAAREAEEREQFRRLTIKYGTR